MLLFLSCTISWLGLDWAIASISIYCICCYPVILHPSTIWFRHAEIFQHGVRVFSDYVTSGVHCCHQKSFLASFHTFTSTSSSLHESPKRLIFCYCVLILFRPVSDHFVAMFSKTTMRHSLSSPNPRPSGLLKRSLMPLCLLSGHCFLRQRCLYVLY